MVAMTLTALKREFARLFVNNLTGEIEADEVLTILDDFADSVTFPAAPVAHIQSFSIQGQSALVDPDTTLSGSVTFVYNVNNPGDVVGNLTIDQAGVDLSTTVDPAGTSVALTLNSVTLSAGQSVVFTISGNRTGSVPITLSFTVTARQVQDYTYNFTDADADFSDFNINTANRTPFANPQSYQIAAYSGLQHIAFAQRQTDPAISEILIGSANQLGGFSIAAGALTIGGVLYDVYYSTNALLGSVMSGRTVTVVR